MRAANYTVWNAEKLKQFLSPQGIVHFNPENINLAIYPITRLFIQFQKYMYSVRVKMVV